MYWKNQQSTYVSKKRFFFRTWTMFSALTFSIILCCTTYILLEKLITKIKNNKVSVTAQNLIQASQIGISLVELQGTSENAQKHQEEFEECDTESRANEVSDRQVTYQANPNIGPDGKNKSVLGLSGIFVMALTGIIMSIPFFGQVFLDWKLGYLNIVVSYLIPNIMVSFILPIVFFIRQPKCLMVILESLYIPICC